MDESVYITKSNRGGEKTFHTNPDCKHLVRVQKEGWYFARVTRFEAERMGRVRECSDCKGRSIL